MDLHGQSIIKKEHRECYLGLHSILKYLFMICLTENNSVNVTIQRDESNEIVIAYITADIA